MKMMKTALLATAAIAAVSVSARADELSDLKAQIEALNARVASVEAAPAVPAGYQLLSVSKGENGIGTTIGIMPTADAPAGTELTITGEIRAALVYQDNDAAGVGGDDDMDLKSRGGITISGKTDTAVGEVGGKFSMIQSVNITTGSLSDVSGDGYWGYWKISDELTLGGGRDGSLAGLDGSNACTCYYNGGDQGFGRGDPSQMRLSYASGPISFAVALEDASRDAASDDAFGVAAEMKYAADMLSFEIAGGAWDDDDYVAGAADAQAWQVGVGIGLNLDIVTIKAAAAMADYWSGDDGWAASALASFSLSDTVSAELGAGYADFDSGKRTSALAAVYYSPVSQLKFGLEAGYSDPSGANNDVVTVDFVSIYKF